VTNVNFSLTVGTVVPRAVRIVVLPPRVVEIYPAWRGYYYFFVGQRNLLCLTGSTQPDRDGLANAVRSERCKTDCTCRIGSPFQSTTMSPW
jgi:hypothetical protein